MFSAQFPTHQRMILESEMVLSGLFAFIRSRSFRVIGSKKICPRFIFNRCHCSGLRGFFLSVLSILFSSFFLGLLIRSNKIHLLSSSFESNFRKEIEGKRGENPPHSWLTAHRGGTY